MVYYGRNTKIWNNETRNTGRTAKRHGTVAEQLNITRNISGTTRNNGTIQNEERL